MSAGVAPCASKGEIGALLSDFLGRSAPEISSLSPDQLTVVPTTNMNNMTLGSGSISAQDQGSKKRKTSENESTDSDGGSVSKKARRRKQNRVAAQTSREKKKKYLTNLESQVQALNQQNMDLQSRLLALEEENKRLKQGCSMAPSIPESEALVKVEPMIKLEPKATAAPYYTGTGDHECLSSSMQTPAITFESAVFYFPQQLEVMTSFALMLNLVFLTSQVLMSQVLQLPSLQNLFRSFLCSPQATLSMTSPATTESSTSHSDLSLCPSSAKLSTRPPHTTPRRRTHLQKKSRLVHRTTSIAVAA